MEPGTRLGPYTLVAPLGEGGMGTVYRARDTELNRDVAIKVLRPEVAGDPDRLTRFTREAQVLASLNHPNIGAIYGITDAGGRKALVLELVEGPTLADRIASGPLPINESLVIAQQLVDALDAAHAQGIVHRDLKPANIKIRPDGTVKVLDFGLAKATDSALSASTDPAAPPTITAAEFARGYGGDATQVGMILGTAAYMSPEQASGKPIDKRSDIWAFGVVLYEMVTGRRPFTGERISDVLAAVLTEAPDLAGVPPHLRPLIVRCLERNPKKRLRDIGDAMTLVVESTPEAAPSTRKYPLGWIVAAALLVAVGFMSVPYFRSAPDPLPMRYEIPAPPEANFVVGPGCMMEVSPDGRHIAFVASVAGKDPQLFVRAVDDVKARAVASSHEHSRPFWSPDSRFVAFAAGGQLKKVDVTTGAVNTISKGKFNVSGIKGAWGADVILVDGNKGLIRVAPNDGTSTPLTTLGEGERFHNAVRFLPDGQHFLLFVGGQKPGTSAVYVASTETTERTRLLATDHKVTFSPPDRFFFVRDEALVVQTLNMRTFALEGEPVEVIKNVMTGPYLGLGGFSVSENGLLVFAEGTSETSVELAWYERSTGRILHSVGTGPYQGIDLSPDEKRVAVHLHGERNSGGDVSIIDLERNNISTRLTFDASRDNSSPIWSPDGASVVFSSLRNGRYGIYRKASNGVGDEEVLFESVTRKVPSSFQPDGKAILFVDYDEKTGGELWILPLIGDRTPKQYLRNSGYQNHGQISPDGHWVAYTSTSGVWIQSYPVPGTRYRAGGPLSVQPRWRAHGGELLMSSRPVGRMWSVSVSANGRGLTIGEQTEVFNRQFFNPPHTNVLGAATNYHTYAVSADGQRILAPRLPAVDNQRPSLTVVLNWAALLKK